MIEIEEISSIFGVILSKNEFIILNCLIKDSIEGLLSPIEIVDKHRGLIKQSTLYAALPQMRKKKLITVEAEHQPEEDLKMPKIKYKATDYGKKIYKAHIDFLKNIQGIKI